MTDDKSPRFTTTAGAPVAEDAPGAGVAAALGLTSLREGQSSMATRESMRFEGSRVVVTTERSFDQIVARLESLVGQKPIEQFSELARSAECREAFEHAVHLFFGESDFMKFGEFNHGAWLGLFGIHRRIVRWILGNPPLAFTTIKNDVTAGLFAPVEMSITELDDGAGPHRSTSGLRA